MGELYDLVFVLSEINKELKKLNETMSNAKKESQDSKPKK